MKTTHGRLTNRAMPVALGGGVFGGGKEMAVTSDEIEIIEA